MDEHHIGTVTHYYPNIQVAAVHLDEDVHVGDTIHVSGQTTQLNQKIVSMELDHRPVSVGHAGETVGIWVAVPTPEECDVAVVE